MHSAILSAEPAVAESEHLFVREDVLVQSQEVVLSVEPSSAHRVRGIIFVLRTTRAAGICVCVLTKTSTSLSMSSTCDISTVF